MYDYDVRQRGLENEYRKPNDRVGLEPGARRHEDLRSWGS